MSARGWRIGVVAVALAGAAGLAPGGVAGQGWIEPAAGRETPVRRVETDVRVEVEGRVARVEVTEWFRNEGHAVAEGHYLYPVPVGAAFQGFSLFQGETELRGELMDAERARAIYEEIVRRRLDPALIEYVGQDLLRARVFPIEAGETRKVSLRYTQLLDRAGEALHFRYSGSVRGHGIRTGPEPRTIVTPLGGPRPRGPWFDPGDRTGRESPEPGPTRLEMFVADGERFLDPFSPTHDLDVRRDAGRLRVRADGPVEGRLSVFLPLAGRSIGLTVAAHRPPGEDGYAMLTLSPGAGGGPSQPRDLTVVLDVSGSMSGEKMEQARSSVVGLLESLSAGDRFRLVAFSNAVRMHRDGWSPARATELGEGVEWVRSLSADGGTNIDGALEEAFRLESPPERLPVVVFLTDGLPTVGEEDPAVIARRAEARRGRARVFAFGVGHDVNTHLLDGLSARTRGTTTYVEPGENVERPLALLAARIRNPVLTDLRIVEAPARLREIYPATIPDVFAGEELLLLGRWSGQAAEGNVVIEGRRSGRVERFTVRARFPDREPANDWLPRLWASRKLGHLTRQVWLEGTSRGLIEEIRRTALRYGLPSEYTSYLVQEPGVMTEASASSGPVGPGVVRTGRGAVAAAAPSTGQKAVSASLRAAELRDARSERDVDESARRMAEAMAGRLDDAAGLPAAAERRMVAGRLFVLDDGVWTEARPAGTGAKVITVRPYGRGYFDLLAALPELVPVVRELGRVELRSGDVVLRIAADGADVLDPAELDRVVAALRGGPPPRP